MEIAWIEYGKSWDTFHRKAPHGDGLAVAGTQIELAPAGGAHAGGRLLIGEINEMGGVCDDCKEVRAADIVLRYRVLVSPEML